jgi:glycosyltransferase involved in cell wall biosynthesis
MSTRVAVSAIVPVFNEVKNLRQLYQKLKAGLLKVDKDFEIVFVNDGSSDESERVLKQIHKKDSRVCLVCFDRNYGKTAALEAGVETARGEILVLLDSDLQHDPLEIPKLVAKVKEGFAVVTGWRRKRRDKFHRVLFSKVVNGALFLLTGFKAHDFYCGFKCYRRKLVRELGIHSDLYRFVAYLAYRKGLKVAEVPVTYHYRQFGRSQSSLKLLKRAIYDLLILFFVIKHLQKGQYQIKEQLLRRKR